MVGDAALPTPALRSQNSPRNHAPSTLAGGRDWHFSRAPGPSAPGQDLLPGLEKAAWAWARTPGAQCALASRWAGSFPGTLPRPLSALCTLDWNAVSLPPGAAIVASPLKSRS